MARLPLLAPLCLLPFVSACGPNEREVGMWVVFAFPIITLLSAAIAHGYALLWKRLEREVSFSYAPSMAIFAMQLALAISAAARGDRSYLDGTFIALAAAGTSFLTLQLLLLRIGVSLRRPNLSWLAQAPAMIFYPPALVLAFFGATHGDISDLYLVLWILPGYFGLTTCVVLVALLAELGFRGLRLRRARRSQEPNLPRAQVRA